MRKTKSSGKLALALTASALIVAGCGGSDDPDQQTENGIQGSGGNEINSTSGALRVFHASPDAPEVNVLLDNEEVVSNLDYRETSGFQAVAAGEYDIAVEGIVPSGNVRVIEVEDFAVPAGVKATVLAVNTVSSIEPLVVIEPNVEIDAGMVGIQVVHAAPVAQNVDVYVTAFDTQLDSVEPALTFDFKESINVGAIEAGKVRIRVTAPGSKDALYDSGEVDLAGFAGSQILLAATDTTTIVRQDASPIQIVAIAGDVTLPLLDTSTQAAVQVVHASPDAGAAAGGPVEVFAASDTLEHSPIELIDSLSYTDVFPSVSSLAPVPAAVDYSFSVAPDTNTISDAVYSIDGIALVSGADYTVVASGRVGGEPAFGLILAENDSRSIGTQAQLNVIHSAPAAGDVDIFVTPAGAVGAEAILGTSPSLNDFSFGSVTGNIDLAPGAYDIRVFAGSTLAINAEGVQFDAGSVTTAIARGPSEPAGDPADFNLIVIPH